MKRETHTERLGPDAAGAASGGLAAGDEFAGHRIESELGRGGMGVVYRARHLALDLERALKIIAPTLSSDERFRARFRREARAAAAVEHPNVVSVHHAGEEADRLYLSMRLVRGTDVGELVAREGPFEPARAVAILRAVAAGLDAAHERGLVHRDVKPSNILLERRAGAEHVFVTDFGISRLAEGATAPTATYEFIGSTDYVAPEQIEGGDLDRRADVYSLGGVAHHMLTGEPPFPRRSGPATLVAHAAAPRPRASAIRPGLPPDADLAIARAMAVRPADRFATAGELAEAFERAFSHNRSHGRERRRSPATAIAAPARRTILAVVAALALAAVAAAALLAGGSAEDPAEPEAGRAEVAAIDVGRAPVGVAVGDSTVWAASHSDGTLWGIDPRNDRSASRVLASGADRPRSVAVGFGSLWVVDPVADELVRLSTGEAGAARRIPVGRRPSDVVLDRRFVWVANEGDDTVSRIDPSENVADRVVKVGDAPRSIAAGRDAVWVANMGDGSVSRIDPDRAATVAAPIDVGSSPNDLAVGAGSVWVVDSLGDSLRRIDSDTAAVRGDPIEVGDEPRGVAFGLGDVWVANSDDDTVTRVDAADREIVGRPIAVGDDPADVVVGFDSVWTANFRDGTVTRIEP